jgi:hypothetical protein
VGSGTGEIKFRAWYKNGRNCFLIVSYQVGTMSLEEKTEVSAVYLGEF